MIELDLYKWITENDLECRWNCRKNKEPELLLWIHQYMKLGEFTELIGYDCATDGAMEVVLLSDGDIVVDIKDVCLEWWGINPLNITKHDFDFEMHGELAKSWEDEL